MKFKGAVLCEQGHTFAVVSVKQDVIDKAAEADKVIASFEPIFPGLKIVLMRQDSDGKAFYYGDTELSKMLTGISVRAIPLREYAWDDE